MELSRHHGSAREDCQPNGGPRRPTHAVAEHWFASARVRASPDRNRVDQRGGRNRVDTRERLAVTGIIMRRKHSGIDRRTLLGWSMGGALGLALPGCKKSPDTSTGTGTSTGGDTREVVIGYVSPQTGPLAAFAEADAFIVERVTKALDAKGIMVDGKKARLTVK